MPLLLKRVYEPAEPSDGFRVLVDRLWPRGVSKDAAAIDLWLKDAAPSPELRKWFGHEPEKWAGFCKRYRAELAANKAAVGEVVRRLKKRERITLLYAARDENHTHAIMLRDFIAKVAAPKAAPRPTARKK